MKILKRGHLPQLREYRATCNSCRCEFVFEEREARYVSDHRDGDYLEIKCPEEGCNANVCIKTSR